MKFSEFMSVVNKNPQRVYLLLTAPNTSFYTNEGYKVSLGVVNMLTAPEVHVSLADPNNNKTTCVSAIPGATLREMGAAKEKYERWLKDDLEFYWLYRVVDGMINGQIAS